MQQQEERLQRRLVELSDAARESSLQIMAQINVLFRVKSKDHCDLLSSDRLLIIERFPCRETEEERESSAHDSLSAHDEEKRMAECNCLKRSGGRRGAADCCAAEGRTWSRDYTEPSGS